MKIDWFDFWLVFSGILLFFLLIGLMIRFFHWFKFRQELAYIKGQKIKDIVQKEYKNPLDLAKSREVSQFKEEMDYLMKDVCFDLYDRNIDEKKDSDNFSFNFEESLEKLLDGKILNLIKEKDFLLEQKDDVIGSLEIKNQKILKEVVNKMFFLLLEKDKVLREKDSLIDHLKTKIQEITLVDLDKQLSQLLDVVRISGEQTKETPSITLEEQKTPIQNKYSHNNDFLNVNFIAKK